ncbi:hypothetical protein CDL15_Pgr017546 [Punica granatum]|uniref:Uncharacterized protein n=1 Tax=Punica granatum TaxID=22663 RepID=A0A218W661_PUNGR|nr:hypothetical protein CDL15_Pgr017546 [Punica granatum]PKI34304.1 hypothetical protein CRG98_045302 [Punica granatum]
MRTGPSDWHRPDWNENGPRGGVGDSDGSDDSSEPTGRPWAPCEFPKVIVRSSYSPETWFDPQETQKPMRMKNGTERREEKSKRFRWLDPIMRDPWRVPVREKDDCRGRGSFGC